MKKILGIITVLLITVGAMSFCHSKSMDSKMNYEQLSKEIGADNAFKIFDEFGLTESTEVQAAKGYGKTIKKGSTVNVVFALALAQQGADSVKTTGVASDSKWFGTQKWDKRHTTGYAVYDCQRFWQSTQAAPPSVTCKHDGAGEYRSFTSSQNNTVTISNWLTVN